MLLGGRSMAFPTTLRIGQPYMLCADGRSRGPGVAGLSPFHGSGGGGGGAGGRCWGTVEGPSSLSRRPPGACTPGSGHVKSDLRPAALPPHPHVATWRRPPHGGTGAAGAAGATPGRASPHTTERTPAGLRPAPHRPPHTGPGARRGTRGPRRGT